MEDYKKKFKDALDDKLVPVEVQELIEETFPELSDSEDERIRKDLIKFIKGCVAYSQEYIDWLEKQGDIDDKFIRMRETKPKDISEFLDRLTTVEQEFLWEHIAKIRELNKEKQNEQKHTTEEILTKVGLKPYKDGDQWCVLLGDNIQEGICGFGNTIEDALYAFLKDLIASQGEQKPTDKVEPKFKVKKGEWYVCTNTFVSRGKIIAIKGQTYQSQQEDDTITCENNCLFIDRHDGKASDYFRYWTIKDAKDGDVLSYVTDEEDLWIMIYWSLYEPYEGHVHYRALLVNNNFSDKGTCCICVDNLKPATKEQRDTLEKAMADAGYTFDFEKKELKKIEQKPAWSEEDESRMDNLCHFLEEYGNQYYGHLTLQGTISWLKSLSPQKQRKPLV